MTATTETSAAPGPDRRSAPCAASHPAEPRLSIGVNWEGLKTLYLKEVRRFWKVGLQTVFAPVITTLLYMMVFVVAMRGARPTQANNFGEFVGPGLIMMGVMNNAFANSSSSLLQAKIMGTSPDFPDPAAVGVRTDGRFWARRGDAGDCSWAWSPPSPSGRSRPITSSRPGR